MLLPQLCFNRLRPVLFRRRCGSGKYKIRQLPDALSRGGAEDSTNVADDRNVKSGTVTTTVESGNGEGELAVLIVNSWLGFITPAMMTHHTDLATHVGSKHHWKLST